MIGGCSDIEGVEEILGLVCENKTAENIKGAIEWLEHWDPHLQPAAVKALYALMKSKSLNNELSVPLGDAAAHE